METRYNLAVAFERLEKYDDAIKQWNKILELNPNQPEVIDNLAMIKKYYEKQLIITGIIPTFYEKRTNMSQEVIEALQDTYKEKVFPAVRVDTKIKQASAANQTIFEMDKQSRGAEDYNQICEVLLDEKKSIKEYTKT